MALERLENQVGILRIVLALAVKDTSYLELGKRVGIGKEATASSVTKLLVLGWIKEERERDFPFTRTFKLTKKGRKAVDSIKDLKKLC